MVNVASKKRCAYLVCAKWPSFGVERSKTAVFCAPHAKQGMVNVINKRCVHPGCNKHRTRTSEGSNMREFRAGQAEDGMVDVQ